MQAPKKKRPTEKLQPWRVYLLRRRNRFPESPTRSRSPRTYVGG